MRPCTHLDLVPGIAWMEGGGEGEAGLRLGLLTLQQEVSSGDTAHGLGPRTQNSLWVVVV